VERKQACRYPRFPNINEQSLYIVEISIVTLIRTDTTLDLSQKAEKSMLTLGSVCVICHISKPTCFEQNDKGERMKTRPWTKHIINRVGG